MTYFNLAVALLLLICCVPVTRVGNTPPVASVEIREASKHVGERPLLPRHYFIDESDPDIVVLRRQDGSFVAAFSAMGATKEDYWRLLGQGGLPEGSKTDRHRLYSPNLLEEVISEVLMQHVA